MAAQLKNSNAGSIAVISSNYARRGRSEDRRLTGTPQEPLPRPADIGVVRFGDETSSRSKPSRSETSVKDYHQDCNGASGWRIQKLLHIKSGNVHVERFPFTILPLVPAGIFHLVPLSRVISSTDGFASIVQHVVSGVDDGSTRAFCSPAAGGFGGTVALHHSSYLVPPPFAVLPWPMVCHAQRLRECMEGAGDDKVAHAGESGEGLVAQRQKRMPTAISEGRGSSATPGIARNPDRRIYRHTGQ